MDDWDSGEIGRGWPGQDVIYGHHLSSRNALLDIHSIERVS